MIEISPLWQALKRWTQKPGQWWRVPLYGLSMLAGVELVAHAAPLLIGDHVNQPLRFTEWPVYEAKDQQKRVRWWTNARGARAMLRRPSDMDIAFFGSSTTMGSPLDQHLTFPEQVKAHLAEHTGIKTHVESFARDGAGNKEAEVIMRDLAAQNVRFDLVVIMDHYAHMDRPATPSVAYRYSQNWYQDGVPKAPELVSRRLRKQLQTEPRVLRLIQDARRAVAADLPRAASYCVACYQHPAPLDPDNRALRQNGDVALVDVDPNVSDARRAFVRDRVRLLVALGSQIADHVVVLSQPIAQTEGEVSGVADQWFSLYPVVADAPIYESNKTVADRMRLINAEALGAARSHGAAVIPLDEYMQPLLRERADLFVDKWHFSPRGARAAAGIVAGQLIKQGLMGRARLID